MNESGKFIAKTIAGIAFAAVFVGWYFSDNIRGYYRFKELCETDGGLKVFHPLQKLVGWRARKGDFSIAAVKNVAFVRYVDRGLEFDARYRSGLVSSERSYDISPAHEGEPILYELRWINERLPDETRMGRSGYEVREIATERLMIRWYQIGYSTFDQDRTLLAAPSGQACYSLGEFFSPDNQSKYFLN
jgi:hypothetical protein